MGKEIRYNLNDYVKFKLTDHGKDIFYHQFDKLNEEILKERGTLFIEPRFPEEDENGYTKMQLWQFMRLYGPHLWNGCEPPIFPTDIVLDGNFVKEGPDEAQF